jgi:multiple sugar transport system substrate-binding protein
MKLKSLVSLLIIMSFLVLAACGSGSNNTGNGNAANNTSNNSQQDTGSKTPEDVELRMAWWGGQDRHDKTLEVIELYEAQNPHVTIVAEYSGFDGYFDKLTTQFAAGNAPDIIQYGGNLNDFVARGVVLPLNDYTGDQLDISKHDQSMLDSATFDGNLYGVTLGSNAFGVLLNKTMFDKANVALPSRDWTWEDLNKIGVKLTESLDGVYGTADFEENGFSIFLEQRGKAVHVDGVLGFDETDVMDWFQLWDDMRKSGAAVIPEIQASASQTPEQSLLVTNQVAIQLIANNQFGSYSGATEDELQLYIYPYGNYSAPTQIRGRTMSPYLI